MSTTKTLVEAGQYRADPGKKGRIVKVISKCMERHKHNDWLVKTIGAGGRLSTISGFRLVCWPIVDAYAITTDPKDTP
jgi:hypothetical protein